ncbi:glycosyltransferase family 4 protein [Candidatus Parcubacteria bacterium]|nr:glycosyltransferase family 4 protein [Candidatus Parcubacteria bacterium]
MNILYILNGLGFARGMPPGGADKKALETAKRLQKMGCKIGFLTTISGQEMLKAGGLEANYHLVGRGEFRDVKSAQTLFGRVFSYLYVTLASGWVRLPIEDYDVVYPTSDLFFDLVPAWLMKRRNRNLKYVGIVHHWIDLPWRRRGRFLFNLLLFVSQRFGFLLLRLWADLILVPQSPEGENVKKALRKMGIRSGRVGYTRNGVDCEAIRKVKAPSKQFEACFLGGLRPSKGIFDLVEIWQAVQKEIPEAKLLVIGGGMADYREELERQIKETGMSKAIELAGAVPQKDLFKKVKSARVFISPSYEEGWGIVVSEALAAGLPVVAYDLPAYRIFGEAIVKVPLGDKGEFAGQIIRLLGSEKEREILVARGNQVVPQLSWEAAAEIELKSLKPLLE